MLPTEEWTWSLTAIRSFQTAGLLGTLAPAAATWLFSASGNSWTPVALAFAGMALVSAVCLVACDPGRRRTGGAAAKSAVG
ncbi:hypothetical protein J7E91_11290 [Streptomyces sp. ISL-99]|nr:hypothetical protein [Streptomyces sp. ISL-99]